METQTVTLTKREAAMKMSLDMIREWCCSNLKGKKAVKIAISCGKKRYEFLADHTGFVLKGKIIQIIIIQNQKWIRYIYRQKDMQL